MEGTGEAGALVREDEEATDDPPRGQMVGMRVCLIFLSVLPMLVPGVTALSLSSAPVHLMVWAAVPIGTLSLSASNLITVELGEAAGFYEELHAVAFWATCALLGGT